MKTIVKKLILLDVKDVEEALSSYWEKSVSIAEAECTLIYSLPADTATPSGMCLEFMVGDEGCDSFDLFDEDDSGIFTWKDKKLSLYRLVFICLVVFVARHPQHYGFTHRHITDDRRLCNLIGLSPPPGTPPVAPFSYKSIIVSDTRPGLPMSASHQSKS